MTETNVFSIDSALETGTKLMGWCFETISANPILTAVFVIGVLMPCGIAMFGHFRRAVK